MSQGDAPYRKTRKSYDIEGHVHYLTFSCFQRRPFFSGRRSPIWLLESLDAARRRHRFELWAWVIMPEHVHLMILPPPEAKISRILQSIKQSVAQKALVWVREHSPDFLSRMRTVSTNGTVSHRFWLPGGGYDRNTWTAAELHEKIHYIHANPVRRGLVENPGDWPWSSWRAWEEESDEPIRIDRESLPPIIR